MRLFMIGDHYRGWRRALERAGHDVGAVNHWNLFASGRDAADVNTEIQREAESFRPDAILQFKGWVDGQKYAFPAMLAELKQNTGAPLIYWSVDDPDFCGDWRHYLAAAPWDAVMTCSRWAVEFYRSSGVRRPYYFLPGFDTDWLEEAADAENAARPFKGLPNGVEPGRYDLIILGHPYGDTAGADLGRARLALAAKRAGLEVGLWGPPGHWDVDRHSEANPVPFVTGHPGLAENYNGWLEHDQVWRALLSAKVVLNNHLRKGGGYEDRFLGYVNDKVPQIAGMGGAAQLMDFQPGMSPDVLRAGAEFYEYAPSLDPEVCLGSALQIVRDAIENESARRAVVEAAQERCLAEHTWKHRVVQFEAIVADCLGG